MCEKSGPRSPSSFSTSIRSRHNLTNHTMELRQLLSGETYAHLLEGRHKERENRKLYAALIRAFMHQFSECLKTHYLFKVSKQDQLKHSIPLL